MWSLSELIIVECPLNVLIYHISVFSPDGEATISGMGPSSYPSLSDIDINIAGVTDLLKEINPYKVTGPIAVLQKYWKK